MVTREGTLCLRMHHQLDRMAVPVAQVLLLVPCARCTVVRCVPLEFPVVCCPRNWVPWLLVCGVARTKNLSLLANFPVPRSVPPSPPSHSRWLKLAQSTVGGSDWLKVAQACESGLTVVQWKLTQTWQICKIWALPFPRISGSGFRSAFRSGALWLFRPDCGGKSATMCGQVCQRG